MIRSSVTKLLTKLPYDKVAKYYVKQVMSYSNKTVTRYYNLTGVNRAVPVHVEIKNRP